MRWRWLAVWVATGAAGCACGPKVAESGGGTGGGSDGTITETSSGPGSGTSAGTTSGTTSDASAGTASGATSDASGWSGGSSTGPVEGCGDGQVQPPEACDDGNTESFDGCSASCQVEEEIVKLSVGGGPVCVLFVSGRLKCWGLGWFGQLGNERAGSIGDEPGEMGPNLPYMDTGFAVVEDVEASSSNVCVIGDGGQVRCWGSAYNGTLGQGWAPDWQEQDPTDDAWGDDPGETPSALPPIDLGGEPAHALSQSAGYQVCAALTSGVKCWGGNENGELGLEGIVGDIGDEPGEMGANLPYVNLAMGKVVMIARAASCALDETGGVKCWGDNADGRLGLGYAGGIVGDEPGEMGANLPYIDLPGKAVDLDGLITHCVVLEDGTVRCWGVVMPGAGGGMGIPFPWYAPDYTIWGDEPGEMGANMPVLEAGEPIVELDMGDRYACVRTVAGNVRCWGANDKGQLGQGHTDMYEVPLSEIPDVDLGEPAKMLGVGNKTACAVLESGNVKCWGYGATLGLGDEENRGDDPGEMGENLPYVELF